MSDYDSFSTVIEDEPIAAGPAASDYDSFSTVIEDQPAAPAEHPRMSKFRDMVQSATDELRRPGKAPDLIDYAQQAGGVAAEKLTKAAMGPLAMIPSFSKGAEGFSSGDINDSGAARNAKVGASVKSLPFFGGVMSAAEAKNFANIARRFEENPDQVTDAELASAADFTARGQYLRPETFAQEVGQLGVHAAGLMVEMASTGGLSAVGRGVAGRAAMRLAPGALTNSGRIAAVKAVGEGVARGTAAAVMQTPGNLAGRIAPTLDKQGNLAQGAPLDANTLTKAFVESGIDAAAEIGGAQVVGALGRLGKKVSPAMAKKIADTYNRVAKSMPPVNRTVQKVFNSTAFQGPVAEFNEERFGELAKMATGGYLGDAEQVGGMTYQAAAGLGNLATGNFEAAGENLQKVGRQAALELALSGGIQGGGYTASGVLNQIQESKNAQDRVARIPMAQALASDESAPQFVREAAAAYAGMKTPSRAVEDKLQAAVRSWANPVDAEVLPPENTDVQVPVDAEAVPVSDPQQKEPADVQEVRSEAQAEGQVAPEVQATPEAGVAPGGVAKDYSDIEMFGSLDEAKKRAADLRESGLMVGSPIIGQPNGRNGEWTISWKDRDGVIHGPDPGPSPKNYRELMAGAGLRGYPDSQPAAESAVTPPAEPIKAYHGTSREFTEYDPEKTGDNIDQGFFGVATYFTSDPELGKHYARSGQGRDPSAKRVLQTAELNIKNPYDFGVRDKHSGVRGEALGFGGQEGKGIPVEDGLRDAVYARAGIEPIATDSEYDAVNEKKLSVALRDELLARGYDGAVAKHPNGSKEYAAYNKGQAKIVGSEPVPFGQNKEDALDKADREKREAEQPVRAGQYDLTPPTNETPSREATVPGPQASAVTKNDVVKAITGPFNQKAMDALVGLGVIERYNPETGAGAVGLGGHIQPLDGGGFASGDLYFKNDGSITYIADGFVVKFDKNGSILQDNSAEVKAKRRDSRIQGIKEGIAGLRETLESEDFKYKSIEARNYITGESEKSRRLKTPGELKAATNKIIALIAKSEAELRAIGVVNEAPQKGPTTDYSRPEYDRFRAQVAASAPNDEVRAQWEEFFPVIHANAEWWAKNTGRPVEDYYGMATVEAGDKAGPVGEGELNQGDSDTDALKAAFDRVDTGRKRNFSKLSDVRKESGLSREAFDAALRKLRVEGYFTLNSNESKIGTPEEMKEMRAGGITEGGSLLTWISRKGFQYDQPGKANGKTNPRGRIKFISDIKALLTFYKKADASTFVHEMAHFFERRLEEADPVLYAQVTEALGGKPKAPWTTEMKEQFARQYERYLANGEAPTPALETAFEKFKDFMLSIYKSIVGTPLAIKLDPQLKLAFDEMHGGGPVTFQRDAIADAKKYVSIGEPKEAIRILSKLDFAGFKSALSEFGVTPKGLSKKELAENSLNHFKKLAVIPGIESSSPAIAAIYRESAGVKEGYTIGEHSQAVVNNLSRAVRESDASAIGARNGIDARKVMLYAAALHDIGKPAAIKAGSSSMQHEFTGPMVDEYLDSAVEVGFNNKEKKLIRLLSTNDVIGELVQGTLDPKSAAAKIGEMAASAGISTADFMTLQSSFYKADAGSYPGVLDKALTIGSDEVIRIPSIQYGTLEELIYGKVLDIPWVERLRGDSVGPGGAKSSGGVPRFVHGTAYGFDAFDPSKDRGGNTVGPGVYLISPTDSDVADHYAERALNAVFRVFKVEHRSAVMSMPADKLRAQAAVFLRNAEAFRAAGDERQAKRRELAAKVLNDYADGRVGRNTVQVEFDPKRTLVLGTIGQTPNVADNDLGSVISEEDARSILSASGEYASAVAAVIQSSPRGGAFYIGLEKAVGSRKGVNKILTDAGFDSIQFIHYPGSFGKQYNVLVALTHNDAIIKKDAQVDPLASTPEEPPPTSDMNPPGDAAEVVNAEAIERPAEAQATATPKLTAGTEPDNVVGIVSSPPIPLTGPVNSISKWFKRNMTSAGYMPEWAFTAAIKADNTIAAEVKRSEIASIRLRDAMLDQRTAWEKTKSVAAPELNRKMLDAVNSALAGDPVAIESLPENVALAAASMRSHIDTLSRRLLDSGLILEKLEVTIEDEGGEVDTTPKGRRRLKREKAKAKKAAKAGPGLHKTIESNMGKYVVRSYQVFDDPAWRDKLDPVTRSKAHAFLKDEFTVPDGVADRSWKEIQKIAHKLGVVKTGEKGATKEVLLDRLQKKPAITDAEITTLIEQILTKDGATTLLSGQGMVGGKDLSVLKKRKQIADPIRALLGEYKDPFVNYKRSVLKLASLAANHKFLTGVRNEGMGKWLFEKDDLKRPPQFQYEFPAGDALSPLSGLVTTKEIRDSFEKDYGDPYRATSAAYGAFRLYSYANGLVKYNKTVMSPVSGLRNFWSNGLIAIQNGHFDLRALGEAMALEAGSVRDALPDVARQFTYAQNLAYRDQVERYVRLGLINHGVLTGELKATIADAGIKDTPRELRKNVAYATVAGVFDVAEAMYQGGDNVWKVQGFEVERAKYKQAYESAGQPLSEEQLDEVASHIITRITHANYDLVPRAVKAVRIVPVVGSFVSFSSEMIRTTWKSILLAREEINNPVTREIGYRRAATLLLANALPAMITAGAMALVGISYADDDDLRKHMPPWMQNAYALWIGKDRESGMYRYIDLSFMIPQTLLHSSIMALFSGETIGDGMLNAAMEFLDPFASEEILFEKITDARRNKKAGTGAKVYNPQASKATQWAQGGAHILGALAPGWWTSAMRVKDGLYGTGDRVLSDEVFALSGFRAATVNIKRQLGFEAGRYLQDKRDAVAMFTEPYTDSRTISAGAVADGYVAAENARRRLFSDMHERAIGAVRLGLPRDEVETILRANNMSREEVEAVMNNNYTPYSPSSDQEKRLDGNKEAEQRRKEFREAAGTGSTPEMKERMRNSVRADVANAAENLTTNRDHDTAVRTIKASGLDYVEAKHAYYQKIRGKYKANTVTEKLLEFEQKWNQLIK